MSEDAFFHVLNSFYCAGNIVLLLIGGECYRVCNIESSDLKGTMPKFNAILFHNFSTYSHSRFHYFFPTFNGKCRISTIGFTDQSKSEKLAAPSI